MDFTGIKYIVVGSGFFGSVMAERIANDLQENVAVLESRNHIGGNSFSEINAETGIEVHKYGSHIFHTSNEEVWTYINRFASFNNYHHKVLTKCKEQVYNVPINLSTINSFYKKNFNPHEAYCFLQEEIKKENTNSPQNFEDQGIKCIGRSLYNSFIKGYTLKQWGCDPKMLPASIIKRLPVRFNYSYSYFDDPWQGIPLDGYGQLFKNLLDHPKIDVHLGINYFDVRDQIPKDAWVIYSGPIDCFFNYKFGVLGWRNLDFKTEIHDVVDFQGTTVMNYADEDVPFTRIHEFKHYHPERKYNQKKTIIFKEYSKQATRHEMPFYPIGTRSDKEMFNLYLQEVKKISQVLFGGRLGSYKYLNMDQVIAAALKLYGSKVKGLRNE